ncbi:MAG: hypothetical protein L0Y76_02895 [Ignavibacteria bacterium]|nr:hypothetical protein [Ignavibacteria bacterium]
MKNIKNLIPVFIAVLLLFGCSKVNDYLKSFEQSSENTWDDAPAEETDVNKTAFYNKYIDVMNSLSPYVDNFQKTYYESIPEPSSLTAKTYISFAGAQISLSFMESEIKKHKRSYFEGGELSKLELKDENMKNEIENSFKEYLAAVESYYSNAKRVYEYYKDSNYKEDIPKAKVIDRDIKERYADYNLRFDSFKTVLKKYKPVRKLKNPDDYSNTDEKAAVIMQNNVEITMDNAEKFYEKFSVVEMTTDITGLKTELETFKKTFDNNRSKVLSAPFSEKSFYLKNSFEDYFSKMVYNFINAADELFKKMEKGNMNSRNFGYAYDNVKNYYNYTVQAYNTTITLLNSFRVY